MRRFIFLLFASVCFFAFSATISDVRALIEKGDYKAALQAVEPLRKKSPRDGEINYWYARAELGLNNTDAGLTALATAAERGYTEAYPELIEAYLNNYDVDKAGKFLEDWKAALRKSKKSDPEDLTDLESRIILMANQLSRVEDIPVIAQYKVARSSFDQGLNKIENNLRSKGLTFINSDIPFFINNSNREVFWTEADDNGVNRLFTAGILDDGTREDPVELTEYVGDGDIMSPFMLEDGETLYFASDRDGGLGGYDIYMTRRDGQGGFYEPSNVGMPYNSPGDDVLYVIDEQNNLGWWATDRFTEPDSLTIFVFVPNASRINIPTDNEMLAARAKMEDITKTVPANFDLDKAKNRIPAPTSNGNNDLSSPSFELSLGDGRVLTDVSQFRSREAASSMSDVMRTERILNDTIARLESMRRAFANGDKSLREDIRALEKQIEKQQNELKNLKNRVIRLETSRRN